MKRMIRVLSILTLLTGMIPLSAETVVVNFQAVFEQYHELIRLDTEFRESVQVFQREQEEKVRALQQKQEAFNQLRARAAQSDINDEQRRNMAEEAVVRLEELNREEQNLREERGRFQQELEAKGLRLRREIADQVTRRIGEMAQLRGWTLVLDSSARSSTGLPVVQFATPGKDMTALVVRELNTPASSPSTTSQP